MSRSMIVSAILVVCSYLLRAVELKPPGNGSSGWKACRSSWRELHGRQRQRAAEYAGEQGFHPGERAHPF